MESNSKRRQFLSALLASLSPVPTLAQITRLCYQDRAIADPNTALTIDTHTHFFNGSDLQVREFLSQNMVRPDDEMYPLINNMLWLLQKVTWANAPDMKKERAALGKYRKPLEQCPGGEQFIKTVGSAHQDGYALGAQELKKAVVRARGMKDGPAVLGPGNDLLGIEAAIQALPPTVAEFEGDQLPPVLQTQPDVAGYLRFMLHHFNYRHINAINYFKTYSPDSERKVDLAVASLVDFDYWLAKGRRTRTSLADQVELMSDISVLFGGRVHGFVPFCPFRETMTTNGGKTGASLRLVKHAIEQCGFIGVKLYPPMGFAAWGNTGQTVWQGKKSIDRVAWRPEFGKRLDQAMANLFNYCRDNDVPVMAHTNNSNGPYQEFRELASSKYWKSAFDRFPGLRVSFGHFGNSNIEDDDGADTRLFLDLMTSSAGGGGSNAYADSGFFAGAMVDPTRMRDTLRHLYESSGGIMRNRLMYGSDWHMILTQVHVKQYLAQFIVMMQEIEEEQAKAGMKQSGLSNAFFGNNAAEFLGLRGNRGNRIRLEKFYESRLVPQPDWMRKLGSH